MTCLDHHLVPVGRGRQERSHRGEDTWLHWALSSSCARGDSVGVSWEHRRGTGLPGLKPALASYLTGLGQVTYLPVFKKIQHPAHEGLTLSQAPSWVLELDINSLSPHHKTCGVGALVTAGAGGAQSGRGGYPGHPRGRGRPGAWTGVTWHCEFHNHLPRLG